MSETAAKALIRKLEPGLNQKTEKNEALKEFITQIKNQLILRAEELKPTKKITIKTSPIEIMREILNNFDKYEEIINIARDYAKEKFKKEQNKLLEIDNYLYKISNQPFSKIQLEKIVKEAINKLNINIDKLIRDLFENQNITEEKIKDYIMQELNIKDENITNYIKELITDTIKDITKIKKQKTLDLMLKERKVKSKLKTALEVFQETMNIAGTDNNAILDKIFQKLNLPQKLIKESLKDMGIKIDELAKGKVDIKKLSNTIIEKVDKEVGIINEYAKEKWKNDIEKGLSDIIENRRETILNARVRHDFQTKSNYKDWYNKLTDLVNLTGDKEEYYNLIAKMFDIPSLTRDDINKIKDRIDEIETIEKSIETPYDWIHKERLKHSLQLEIKNIMPANCWDLIENYYYSSMLSGVTTYTRNAVETFINVAIENLIVNPITDAIDSLSHLIKGNFDISGMYANETWKNYWKFFKAIKYAPREWGRELKYAKLDFKEFETKTEKNMNKFINCINFVAKNLQAADAFLKTFNYENSLSHAAIIKAINEFKTNKNISITELYKKYMQTPTEDMFAQMIYEAKRNTFNQNPEGLVGALINKIIMDTSKGNKFVKISIEKIRKFFIPFTKIAFITSVDSKFFSLV